MDAWQTVFYMDMSLVLSLPGKFCANGNQVVRRFYVSFHFIPVNPILTPNRPAPFKTRRPLFIEYLYLSGSWLPSPQASSLNCVDPKSGNVNLKQMDYADSTCSDSDSTRFHRLIPKHPKTVWWFGTFYIFHILGRIIPTDSYFSEG
jgi:hypothetical protein